MSELLKLPTVAAVKELVGASFTEYPGMFMVQCAVGDAVWAAMLMPASDASENPDKRYSDEAQIEKIVLYAPRDEVHVNGLVAEFNPLSTAMPTQVQWMVEDNQDISDAGDNAWNVACAEYGYWGKGSF